jgi:hypothetical protein
MKMFPTWGTSPCLQNMATTHLLCLYFHFHFIIFLNLFLCLSLQPISFCYSLLLEVENFKLGKWLSSLSISPSSVSSRAVEPSPSPHSCDRPFATAPRLPAIQPWQPVACADHPAIFPCSSPLVPTLDLALLCFCGCCRSRPPLPSHGRWWACWMLCRRLFCPQLPWPPSPQARSSFPLRSYSLVALLEQQAATQSISSARERITYIYNNNNYYYFVCV